jgi:hypothetical protein
LILSSARKDENRSTAGRDTGLNVRHGIADNNGAAQIQAVLLS